MQKKRNILYRFLSRPSLLFPVQFYTKLTGHKLILPLYHSVCDKAPAHLKWLYPVRNKKQFKRDLDFYLRHFRSVPLHEFIHEKISTPSFHLTFDDGLRECYDTIAPILLEKGIHATFFINPAFLDNKELMYRCKISLLRDKLNESPVSACNRIKEIPAFRNTTTGITEQLMQLTHRDDSLINSLAELLGVDFKNYLSECKPYMNTEQVNDLIKKGFTVGAHSMTHPDYRLLSHNEQILQTKESIDFINNKFSPGYRTFAFPFTDDRISNFFFDTVFSHGEKIADNTFGGAGLKKDYHPLHFQRIPIETNTHEAKRIIKFEYFYYLLKAPFGKNRIHR